MATIRLVPSTYYLSNSTYLSVTNPSNMYANTDSTTYGQVYNSRSSTTSYYIYLRGFNFDDVPSDAIVSSITIKIKAYHSGGNTSTIYCYDGTTQIAACGSTTALSTSATVKTFTNTTVDWDTLKGYGSDFGIRINCRRSNKSTAAYVYIYGAEIDVEYTVPVYHNVTVTGDSTKVTPTGTESVLEGDSYSVAATYDSRPTVTDNGVDVSNQLVESSGGTSTLIPYDYTSTNFTVSNISNAYDDASSTNYASFEINGGSTTGTLYLDLGGAVIPSNATIQSVSCSATLQYNRNGSSSGASASCQLYSGNTAKGSSTSIISAGNTDVAKTTFNLSIGSWSASEIANARFYLTMTNNASSTHRFMYVYGVSFSVTYTISGKIYIYTINSVTGDHTIVVTAPVVATDKMYVKVNGTYVEGKTIYKKISGTWTVQTDLTNVYDNGTNYQVVVG